MRFILRGRRSIWPVALRIVNVVICDADQSCSFCVAGAVFAEVGGCLLLLRAL